MAHNPTAVNVRAVIAEPAMLRDADRSTEHGQLSEHQLIELNDERKQAEYRKAYELQLMRQACPSCGEG